MAEPEYDRDTNPNARPSRTGLKTVVTYLEPEVLAALRHVAIDQEKSLQALGQEAYALLLAQYKVDVKIEKKVHATV
jgi:hypothetical protein